MDELDELKAFLDDAARYRQSNSKQWSQFVHKVQVIVYQAVDKLLVQVKLHQEKNIFKQLFDANYAMSVRELAKNIKVALEQVKKIRQENPEAFQKKPMLDDQPEIVAPRPQVCSKLWLYIRVRLCMASGVVLLLASLTWWG